MVALPAGLFVPGIYKRKKGPWRVGSSRRFLFPFSVAAVSPLPAELYKKIPMIFLDSCKNIQFSFN
jgi:hypothetical protein